MSGVTANISTSLDGVAYGPNDSRENPLGDGGERLHEWVYDLASWREGHGIDGGETNRDDEILAESIENVGAVVIGRRVFDTGEGPWGDDPFEGHWGEDPPFGVPVFVRTHHPREPLEMEGGTTFTFVTDGIEAALERAEEAAGEEDVEIAGGGDVASQYVVAGLVDDIQLRVSPVLMGGCIRSFERLDSAPIELEQTMVHVEADVTHLRYRVVD